MLSRVITLREALTVEAQPFTATQGPGSRGTGSHHVWPASPAEEGEMAAQLADLAAECARLQAENKMLASRHTALEAELETARRVAFDTGVSQGEQRAGRELAPVIEKMKQAIAETVAARSTMRARAEKDVVQLAVQIAKRILHREIATDTNALSALARVVFERMARSESYTLTIHPRFLEAVQAALTGTFATRVRVEADPACAPGTFVVRSAEGTIDASLDAQLEEISRGLADRLAEG